MFISRHTLKWTKTCRSSGDFPHAHTAHFLLNRHNRRIGEGGPRDHSRGRSDGARAETSALRLPRGRDHARARQPRRPRLHRQVPEREAARGHHPGSRPGTGRACLPPPVDCHDGGIVACTAGSGPDAGLADGMPVKAAETLPEGARPLVHSDRGLPLPVPRMAGPHGTARPDMVDGREGPFPGQRRRGGVLRQDEDGIRPSLALGGTTPRRGTRLGRRLHPLARPRAHQTVARLDEPGTIPPEPGNGRVIISKKTPAAPYPKAYLNMPEIGEIT